jgi:protein-disulfide isomerase
MGRKRLVWITLAIAGIIFSGFVLFHVLREPSYFHFDEYRFPKLGSSQAPVQIVLIEEFTCPGCKVFAERSLPRIQEAYIDQEKAQLVCILVGFTDEARRLGNAALAIFHQDPNAFFPFTGQLFKTSTDHVWKEAELLFLAKQFKTIDLAVFAKDLREGTYEKELEANLRVVKRMMGKEVHTPALFINHQLMKSLLFADISISIEGRL